MNDEKDYEIKRSDGLLGAVGGIGDDLIAEASEQSVRAAVRKRRRRLGGALSGLAACLVLAVSVGAVLTYGGGGEVGDNAFFPEKSVPQASSPGTEAVDIRGEDGMNAVEGIESVPSPTSETTKKDSHGYEELENSKGNMGNVTDGPGGFSAWGFGMGARVINSGGSIAYCGYDTVARTVSLILTLERSADDLEFVFCRVKDTAAVVGSRSISDSLTVTVNGKVIRNGGIPTEPGVYCIDIDYSVFDDICRSAGDLPPESVYVRGFDVQRLEFALAPNRISGMPEPPAADSTDEFFDFDLRNAPDHLY